MKRFLTTIILISCVFICANAQCNSETKALVDSIRTAIPYPKYNIGDVLYIAFINDPEVGTDQLTDKDIDILKVKIVGLVLVNGSNFRSECSEPGLFIGFNAGEEIRWEYQYVDATIEKPRFRDYSNKFYSESRFAQTPNEAKQSLKE